MTPADLLALAADIETDTRIGRLARVITCAVLRGRAERMKGAGKGAGMVGNRAARGTLGGKESDPASVCAPTGPGPIPETPGEDVAP